MALVVTCLGENQPNNLRLIIRYQLRTRSKGSTTMVMVAINHLEADTDDVA
jgi:hypothetical protein